MLATCTRVSTSSTQSTGTSWMRSPLYSASSSNSVSKNQASSCVLASSGRSTSVRAALKPHCASLNRAPCVIRMIAL